jgi:glycosyltransferase involved in cell wall biosynthesis
MNSPEYSVIIATHLRPALLRRSLESVLSQRLPSHQIIVVSDVADQATYEVAKTLLRPRDLFVQCPGIRGPAASRNIALKLVTGTDVVFLDDDDAFRDNFLSEVSRLRGPDRGPEILFTNFEVIHEHENNTITGVNLGAFPLEQVWIKNFIPNNCLIFPYSELSGVNFDETIAYEDWDFVMSAHSRTPLRHLESGGPLIYKNVQEESRGEKNNQHLLECYVRAYKKYPATQTIRDQRKAFFESVGIDIEAYMHLDFGP